MEFPLLPGQHEGAAPDASRGGHSQAGHGPSHGAAGSSSASWLNGGVNGEVNLDNGQPPFSSSGFAAQSSGQAAHPAGRDGTAEQWAWLRASMQRIEGRLQNLEEQGISTSTYSWPSDAYWGYHSWWPAGSKRSY